jgi:hypothetical protein
MQWECEQERLEVQEETNCASFPKRMLGSSPALLSQTNFPSQTAYPSLPMDHQHQSADRCRHAESVLSLLAGVPAGAWLGVDVVEEQEEV